MQPHIIAAAAFILISKGLSADENNNTDQICSHLVSALNKVSEALHCFQNDFQVLIEDNKENKHNINKLVQHLEKKLNTSLEEGQIINDKFEGLDYSVQHLDEKLNTSLEEGQIINDKFEGLDYSVDVQSSKKRICHNNSYQKAVTEQVENYMWSNNWNALRTGLEASLSNDSTAFQQLQYVDYSESHPMWAIGSRDFCSLATLLVCAGLSPDWPDSDRDTMLHAAADSGQTHIARELLNLGADIEARGSSTNTPLMWAAFRDRLNMVRMLTESGASLNATGNNGDTALHVAARKDHLVVVRYLVKAGADPAAPGQYNQTPLDIAESNNHLAMITFLKQYSH